jgi:hypothetical protein
MGLAVDSLIEARADICARIDDLASDLRSLSISQLMAQVEDIRSLARDHGLLPLEQLARGLERALSTSDGGVMVAPFLTTMRDAAGCERVDAAAAQSYLASVNLRLYG